MVTESGSYKYAQTVNPQENPNITKKYNSWQKMVNAVGSDNKTWAIGTYTRTKKGNKYEYTVPWELTAHNFLLDIPDGVRIDKVVVEANFRADNGLVVNPPIAIFRIYGGKGSVKQNTALTKSGWYNNFYHSVSNKKLSNTTQTIQYEFPAAEWKKMQYPNSQLNRTVFGVDMLFQDPISMTASPKHIYLNWVRIKVYYTKPSYYLKYGDGYTQSNPKANVVNTEYVLPVEFGNRNNVNGEMQGGLCVQFVSVELPPNTSLNRYTCSSNSSFYVDEEHMLWACDAKANAVNKLNLYLTSHTIGDKEIVSTHDGVKYPAYTVINGMNTEYGDMAISNSTIQKGEPSCFNFKAGCRSQDGAITFTVDVDGENQSDPSNLSQAFRDYYQNPDGTGNNLVSWELDELYRFEQDGEIYPTIDWENTDNNQITFNIPADTDVEIRWSGCFIPVTIGDNTLYVTNEDTSETYSHTYNSLDAKATIATINPSQDNWWEMWLATEFESEGSVFRFETKSTDRVMIESRCSFQMHLDAPKAYIGCIPLQRSHYEPDSSFSNKTIKEQYKNKKYMGKSGEIEEDISLKIRLPPRDWTTLQGLTELDKPVPINTVPTAFEGDVLNHRGWVELGGVKNVKKTNPLHYDGQLEVDYLTHNINTRFQIARGVKVSTYNTSILSTLLSNVVNFGDEFADYTYVNDDGETVHNNTGLFTLDTDGTYIYDEDVVESKRTLVTLDNHQYVNIKSIKPFTENMKIDFEWASTKIPEDRENNIERIVRIVNKDGLALMEYQYFDYEFDYDDEIYACNVVCRVYDSSIDEYFVAISDDLTFAVDLEALALTTDEFGNVVQQDESSISGDGDVNDSDTYIDEITGETVELNTYAQVYSDYTYGSTLSLELIGNELTICDSGFNGREVYKEAILLEKDEYYLEVEYRNKNSDADTPDIIHFFNFNVQETILTSDFKQDYSDLVVASFPIPNKTFLFTRDSEEGVLYYYKNDGKPFTYIQEPFYMYYRGVDMVAGDGQSIFNLNNSYTTFYVQNGLVRIGFNRYTGRIYFSKYDLQAREYIAVATLQVLKFTDFSLGTYSDDKITIKCGEIVFTVYRGHPYIMVNHPKDDIGFVTIWNKVYADGVNGINDEFPSLWNLVNSENLLPSCVGGLDLKVSCLAFDVVENQDVGTTPTLDLSLSSVNGDSEEEEICIGDIVFFDIEGSVTDVDEDIPVETTYKGSFGEYSSECVVDIDVPMNIDLVSQEKIIQSGGKANIQSMVTNYNNSGVFGQTVYFYEVYTPTTLSMSSDKSIIQNNERADITAKVKDEDGSLVKGETVYFYVKED